MVVFMSNVRVPVHLRFFGCAVVWRFGIGCGVAGGGIWGRVVVMEESEPQVPAQVGAQVPAQVGNEATRFKKGRSGRYVPIEEHRAVLARLAELEGSEELAAKDAELAELRERLAAGEARNRVKVLEGENGELRARVAE